MEGVRWRPCSVTMRECDLSGMHTSGDGHTPAAPSFLGAGGGGLAHREGPAWPREGWMEEVTERTKLRGWGWGAAGVLSQV